MNKRTIFAGCAAVALAVSLAALPAVSGQKQSSQDNSVAALKREIAELKAKLEAAQDEQELSAPVIAEAPEPPESADAVELERQVITLQEPEAPAPPSARRLVMSLDGDGGGWLGVEMQEVTADAAKELKLSSERGALIGKVLPDSPAAKAGLKEHDVVTEINGQRVEGTAQFRRMIHEIPGGRAVQLSVWRDGKQQPITATLGKSEERHTAMMKVAPQSFAFRMPEMPEIPAIRNFDWNGAMLFAGKARLGIDAEDLSGQLGAYFGAPDGEGILVRNVNSGSPAEKAGIKAGDVITTFNTDRIRTAAELREKLARTESGKSVAIGVLRNKSNVTVTVELPAAATKEKRQISFRTSI
ncbi:MAG TPA: PDZ domain-containing protein [Candidatus Acidoferrum sp.]|nr:PDZ domain-containing protein [Candidatus Acidoferrum sp.]